MPSRLAHNSTRRHTGATAPAANHWPELASQWNQIFSPLRPCDQDLAAYHAAIARWSAEHGAPRALILGVTPELYHLPWPAGTQLTAMDHTQRMIDMVWPGPRSAAVCADWTDMPLDNASRDNVLSDGGLSMLSCPHGHARLVRALQRVLSPAGLCAFRLYIPPSPRETPQTVLQDLLDGNIPHLNILKLRLGMALQESSERGVQLGHIWEVLRAAAPDFKGLAEQIGWPLEHLLAINTYRNSFNRYYFPSVAEVCGVFTDNPGGFVLESIQAPTYPLGERCPTIVFRRCSSAST
jgi:SAM-dependent methyltransferase